jgi:hypothetical protein
MFDAAFASTMGIPTKLGAPHLAVEMWVNPLDLEP